MKSFRALEEISRKAIKTLYILYLNLDKITDLKTKDEVLKNKIQFVSVFLRQLSEEVKIILKPHVTIKSIQKIDSVLETISEDLMLGVYKNEKLRDDLKTTMVLIKNVLGWEAAKI